MFVKTLPRNLTSLMVIGLLSGGLIMGCGPADEEADEEEDEAYDEEEVEDVERDDEEEEEYAEDPEPDQEVDIEVVATGNTMAEIAFEQEEVTVPANAKVNLTLINESEGEAMDHNFVVIDEANEEEIVELGMEAGHDADYLPPEGTEGFIAGSPLADPGETIEYEFVTPAEPGEFTFICLYPGHVEQMRGDFIVEEVAAAE